MRCRIEKVPDTSKRRYGLRLMRWVGWPRLGFKRNLLSTPGAKDAHPHGANQDGE